MQSRHTIAVEMSKRQHNLAVRLHFACPTPISMLSVPPLVSMRSWLLSAPVCPPPLIGPRSVCVFQYRLHLGDLFGQSDDDLKDAKSPSLPPDYRELRSSLSSGHDRDLFAAVFCNLVNLYARVCMAFLTSDLLLSIREETKHT